MATPFPPIKASTPSIHQAALRFEQLYLPDEGFDHVEREAKKDYQHQGRLANVKLLARSVLSGGWNMGNTQTGVGEFLGLDHSSLSNSLWNGEMGIDIYNAIVHSDDRPMDWPTPNAKNHMNRAGYIAVAKRLAALVNDRKTLKPEKLTELRYELMCECFYNTKSMVAALAGNLPCEVAAAIVGKVIGDPNRHVVPVWLRPGEADQAEAEVESLRGNPDYAFTYLSDLFANWFDIFAATTFMTEIAHRYGDVRR